MEPDDTVDKPVYAVNEAWLSHRCTQEMRHQWRLAIGRFGFDREWAAWVTESLALDSGTRRSHVLAVDDVDKQRMRMKNKTGEVDLTVPVDRLLRAEAEGTLLPECLDIAMTIYRRAAEHPGVSAPLPEAPTVDSWVPDHWAEAARRTP